MGSDLVEASIDAVVGTLVELDHDLADDLLLVVRAYTQAEARLVVLDGSAGRNVSHRVGRLRRLSYLLDPLERELGLESREVLHLVVTFRRDPLEKRHDSISHTNMRSRINYGAGGLLKAQDVKLEGGLLSGHLTSEGENSDFGEAFDIDAKFSVKELAASK